MGITRGVRSLKDIPRRPHKKEVRRSGGRFIKKARVVDAGGVPMGSKGGEQSSVRENLTVKNRNEVVRGWAMTQNIEKAAFGPYRCRRQKVAKEILVAGKRACWSCRNGVVGDEGQRIIIISEGRRARGQAVKRPAPRGAGSWGKRGDKATSKPRRACVGQKKKIRGRTRFFGGENRSLVRAIWKTKP